MLSLEEKLALLDKALQEETSESLLEKLNSYPACGPNIVEFSGMLKKQLEKANAKQKNSDNSIASE
jgi:flagellar hook-basal body complex protein FliE